MARQTGGRGWFRRRRRAVGPLDGVHVGPSPDRRRWQAIVDSDATRTVTPPRLPEDTPVATPAAPVTPGESEPAVKPMEAAGTGAEVGFGREMAHILELTAQALARMATHAEAEAGKVAAAAEAEAHVCLRAAEEEADRLLASARQEAERIVDEAEEKAARLVAQALAVSSETARSDPDPRNVRQTEKELRAPSEKPDNEHPERGATHITQ